MNKMVETTEITTRTEGKDTTVEEGIIIKEVINLLVGEENLDAMYVLVKNM